jgi:dipeptidyl aminopeptidase/acylaminoacyl peptidase
MSRFRLIPVCAAALAASTVLGAAPAFAADAPQQFPMREFFRHPDKAFFRISEDGNWLSFMQPVAIDGNPRRLNIFIQPLKGSAPVGEARRLTAETARDISGYSWKGSSTLLYEKDFGGDENFHVVAVDARSGKITDLTPYDGVRGSIVDPLRDDADHILVAHNKRDKTVFDIYKVNVHTGESVMVAQNPGNADDWVTDHAGRVRGAVVSDGLQSRVLYRATDKDEFKPIIETDYKTTVSPLFFDADNKKLYAVSNRGRDKKAVVLIDPAKPDAEEVLFQTDVVDVEGASWSEAHKRLAYAEYNEDRVRRRFFDPQYEAVFKKAGAKLPGYELLLQSANRPENKFIVAAFNDRTQGARYIYDAQHDTLSKLGDINPDLPEAAMAPMKPITYTSRDGLPIHGYLTLPVAKEPKNLACIVNPHGGPWARDGWGFNPEVQFLANRGYCVLQMNFRGSTGYGRQFWEASFGQWGLKMQDDVTDGVQWLVKQGIADAKRIGIYGGSYGGYTTLAGVTFTPDLYAAAVDYVGVSNLFTFMKTIPPYWEPFRIKMEAMVGNPERDKERLAQTSPALHADQIKTPLFIAQGARDPRVNKAESDQVVEALKKRGVEVQYMVKDNEGHGFHNEENQFEFYGAMEAFFREHLKP